MQDCIYVGTMYGLQITVDKVSPKSSQNEKQLSERSHISFLLIFTKIYTNMIIQFTYKLKAEVKVLLNYR
jgi:hypothetical protein